MDGRVVKHERNYQHNEYIEYMSKTVNKTNQKTFKVIKKSKSSQ